MLQQIRRWDATSAGRRRRGSLGKNWTRFECDWSGRKIELAARRGWGYSAWALTRKTGEKVSLWGVSCYQEMEAMRKKVRQDASPAQQHVAALESTLFGKHHSIVAHCAVTRYDDGDPRQPGWISIRTFGSVWQVEAKDPDTCQFLRVTQPTLDDALTMLALLLDATDAPWEPDPWAKSRSTKKKAG